MSNLSSVIISCIKKLCSEKLDTIFQILDRILINESNEYNSYVMIRGKFSEFIKYRNFGSLPNDFITTEGQSIRHSILQYLLSLQERDFILEFVEQPKRFIDIRSNIAGPSNESFYF